MDTYAAPLMQFAHVQFLKFTPHLVWDTSGYTGTRNDHSCFGPMHYRMHLNRSVMYYRPVRACLGDRDVPKLEQNHSSPHRLCLHNNIYRLRIAWSGGYYLTGKLLVFLYLY